MIIDTEVEVKIGARNKPYYFQKGYDVKKGDIIIVPIGDLPVGSKAIVNAQCQNPDCGIIKPMQYQTYLYNINSTDIHKYYCNKCSYLKKIVSTDIKQENGTLTRNDSFYWQHEENRIKEFMKYIDENKILDNMKDKDYSLYNAILEYENSNLEFAKKLNLDVEQLFKFKKPQDFYTKEMVVKHIKEFIQDNNRFPSQQELTSCGLNSKVFNKFFKNYSECKKEIGYYNKDDLIDNRGDVNRSYYELYTANFLVEYGLGNKYKREEHQFKEFDSKLGAYRSDFSFYPENKNQIHIEVWGDSESKQETVGYYKDYLDTRKEKERLYNLYSDKIILISIEPSVFSGNMKSIVNKLYNVFKDYLELEYKTIDIELLLPYNSMPEEEIFKKIMECSDNKSSLPYRKDIARIKGGSSLLSTIDKRFGGIGYFAEKYNLKISHRKANYWTEEKIFEYFNYMLKTYGKIFTRKDCNNDNKLKSFYSYISSNGGEIYNSLKYIKNLLDNNIIISDYLQNYLLKVSLNVLNKYKKVKPEHQLLAKQILDKHNNKQI